MHDVLRMPRATERSCATASVAGHAGQAVEAGLNGALLQPFRRQVPEIQRGFISPSHPQAEHLVKIAVVQLAAIINIQNPPAHQAAHDGGIETAGHQL